MTSRPHVVTAQADGGFCFTSTQKVRLFMENRARHFFLLDPERGVKFLSSDQKVLTDTALNEYTWFANLLKIIV